MAAHSFKLDLLQLSHKEFNDRYESPISEKAFLEARIIATQKSFGKLLYAILESDPGAPTLDLPDLTGYIVTKIYYKIIGSGVVEVGTTSPLKFKLDAISEVGPSELTLEEVEGIYGVDAIASPIFTTISGTPSILWMAWGYKPPAI